LLSQRLGSWISGFLGIRLADELKIQPSLRDSAFLSPAQHFVLGYFQPSRQCRDSYNRVWVSAGSHLQKQDCHPEGSAFSAPVH
jgi:hypothetical protein